jgi:hypothetical protein
MPASIRVPAAELRRVLLAVLPARDPDASRYALGAVLLELEQSGDAVKLLAVACDARRLHVADTLGVATPDDVAAWPLGKVLAADPKALAAMLAKVAGWVTLTVTPRATDNPGLSITLPGAEPVTLPVADGRFPRWRDVIPADSGKRTIATVNAKALRDTLAAARDTIWPGQSRAKNRQSAVALGAPFSAHGQERHGLALAVARDCDAPDADAPASATTATVPVAWAGVPPFPGCVTLAESFVRDALAPIGRGAVDINYLDADGSVLLTTPNFAAVICPQHKADPRTEATRPAPAAWDAEFSTVRELASA